MFNATRNSFNSSQSQASIIGCYARLSDTGKTALLDLLVFCPQVAGWMVVCFYFLLQYFRHFIAYAKPSETNPILLLLDGHQSHKSLALVDMARDNFVTVITFPPHTSHRLQPLDVSFFYPLKAVIIVRWTAGWSETPEKG